MPRKSRVFDFPQTLRKPCLLGFGVPALRHELVETPELDLLCFAQRWPKALGELLGYLELVLSQCWPSPGQQLKEHHAVGEHVHLKEMMTEKRSVKESVHCTTSRLTATSDRSRAFRFNVAEGSFFNVDDAAQEVPLENYIKWEKNRIWQLEQSAAIE